jgi:ketosteroid isomerase-like protein
MLTVRVRIFTALLAGAIASHAPANPTEEAAVLRAEKEFSAAVAANDTRGIANLTTEDWQIIDGDGHIIPRTAFLEVISSGMLKHKALSNSDETVRTFGNAAIVTARSKSEGTYADSVFSTDEISTGVWVRKGKRWRCVLTQLTTRKR